MSGRTPSTTDPQRWAHATFPLPALAPEGQGLQLPTISASADDDAAADDDAPRLALPGRLAVAVLADRELVTRLPWAQMVDGRIDVDGAYPGAPSSDLAAAVAHASLAEPVTLLAPSALLASRLLDVLTRMDRPARLAVEGPTLVADYAPPMVLPVVLLPRPAAGATVTPLAAAATSAGNPRGPLVLAITKQTTVQELAALLARVTVSEVALVSLVR